MAPWKRRHGPRPVCSKGFALTWYRALTWYFLRVSSLRTHLEPWTASGTWEWRLPCCPVTSSGASGAATGRAGEEYQVKARYQVRANPLLCRGKELPPPHLLSATQTRDTYGDLCGMPAYGQATKGPLPTPPGRPHRLGLPMVVCVEYLPADKRQKAPFPPPLVGHTD